jgi:hypothetical protein
MVQGRASAAGSVVHDASTGRRVRADRLSWPPHRCTVAASDTAGKEGGKREEGEKRGGYLEREAWAVDGRG